MIIFYADDTDQFALLVSLQAEDQAKLPVEADRALAAEAALALQLLKMEALNGTYIVFVTGGLDHEHLLEERVHDLRRIPGCAYPIGVEEFEFLAGKDEAQGVPQSIAGKVCSVNIKFHPIGEFNISL